MQQGFNYQSNSYLAPRTGNLPAHYGTNYAKTIDERRQSDNKIPSYLMEKQGPARLLSNYNHGSFVGNFAPTPTDGNSSLEASRHQPAYLHQVNKNVLLPQATSQSMTPPYFHPSTQQSRGPNTGEILGTTADFDIERRQLQNEIAELRLMVAQSNSASERQQLMAEVAHLRDELSAAHKTIDSLTREIERLKIQPRTAATLLSAGQDAARLIKTERTESVLNVKPIYTGLPLPQGQAVAAKPMHSVLSNLVVNPAIQTSATSQLKMEGQRIAVNPGSVLVSNPIKSGSLTVREEAPRALTKSEAINPLRTLQNIQVVGQPMQVQTVTANLRISNGDTNNLLSRCTASSQNIGSISELNGFASKSIDNLPDYSQQDTKKKELPHSLYQDQSSPDAKVSPRRDQNIYNTPDSKRSRSRSPPPAQAAGLAAKLKEANSRIRYLADENDKLIGRLHKFKIIEEEMQKREINFEKKIAVALQEKNEAETREAEIENKLHEEQSLVDELTKQLDDFKRLVSSSQMTPQHSQEVPPEPPVEEPKPKKKKAKGIENLKEENIIPEVPDDMASPKPENKPEPVDEEAPKKKKKKAKTDQEDQPREEAPIPHEELQQAPVEKAEDGKTVKKTKKKKAKADESEQPLEVAVEDTPVQEAAVEEPKKKKGTKKKKEE